MKRVLLMPILMSALTSCQGDKEDEALLATHKENKATIESLEDELRAVRLKIEAIRPPEEMPDLEKLKGELKEATNQRVTLEREMRDLDSKKKKAVEELEVYKKEYPIR